MSKVIKLGDYRGIEVKVPKQLSVTEEEINREIQNFLSQNSQLVEKDGEVANGDVSTIDFEEFKDGVPFEEAMNTPEEMDEESADLAALLASLQG